MANIKGAKRDDMHALMGTIRLTNEQAKALGAGVKKTNTKKFADFRQSLGDRVGVTFQMDNRGRGKDAIDRDPFLTHAKYTRQDKSEGVSHILFISGKVGVQRDGDGKPILDGNGQPKMKEGKDQASKLFDALPSVEVETTDKGSFMHFACDSKVMLHKDGLIPVFDGIQGKDAVKGMNVNQFNVTLEAKRAYKAAQQNGNTVGGPSAAVVEQAASMQQSGASEPSVEVGA